MAAGRGPVQAQCWWLGSSVVMAGWALTSHQPLLESTSCKSQLNRVLSVLVVQEGFLPC
jgi:hypothetical protein